MKNTTVMTGIFMGLMITLTGCSYWGDKKTHEAMPPEQMEEMIQDAKSVEQGRHTKPAPIFKKVFTEPTRAE